LNAIAQFTASVDNGQIHGLGTGSLYTNNFPSPLKVDKGHLYYDNQKEWDLSILTWNAVL
jgi:O-succinylbenzoate synthase